MPISINGTTGLTGVAAIDNVSSTELGYVDGVTSAIQTQMDTKYATPTSWTTYTPTWGGSGGTPSIGNGTLAGRYIRFGPMVHVNIMLWWGSTTTANSATIWYFTKPVASPTTGRFWSGSCTFRGSYYGGGSSIIEQGGNITPIYGTGATASNFMGYNVPWTWATGAWLTMDIAYEAA